MTNHTLLATWIKRFLQEYLISDKKPFSQHTTQLSRHYLFTGSIHSSSSQEDK